LGRGRCLEESRGKGGKRGRTFKRGTSGIYSSWKEEENGFELKREEEKCGPSDVLAVAETHVGWTCKSQ